MYFATRACVISPQRTRTNLNHMTATNAETNIATNSTQIQNALANAKPMPFWLDDERRPESRGAVKDGTSADLVVVGGGFTGLWTALRAKEREPERRVILLEAKRLAWAATGRNGGFCDSSLTHGHDNGLSRYPDDIERLDRMGLENLDGIAETIERYEIDCSFERTGTLDMATAPWQLDDLKAAAEETASEGVFDVSFLDSEALAERVKSPTYYGAISSTNGAAMVNPARLAWGLAAAFESLGGEIFEQSLVSGITRQADRLLLNVPSGIVTTRQVALATNVYPSLLKRDRLHTVPVWDYVLVTEPLTDEQMSAIGWAGREGLSDLNNQFHYYRLTDDNRILWGGYDAVYYYGGAIKPEYTQRPETFEKLLGHLWETFPVLTGQPIAYKWGGAIDTCSRFFAFFDLAYGGDVTFAAGFTGLGVGASRFAADVMLDLLDGVPTERTELDMVRKKPMPFPPEPLAWTAITLTHDAMVRADEHEGKRGPLLQVLDRLGLGFDS